MMPSKAAGIGRFPALVSIVAVVTSAAAADPLCAPLTSFVASVQPNDVKQIAFHTVWGSNFKDSPEAAVSAKRCVDNAYRPAGAVCTYLMENGAVEFSGNNAKRALECLSPGTRFGPRTELERGVFSFAVGAKDHGSYVRLEFAEDTRLGGMVLRITADGY